MTKVQRWQVEAADYLYPSRSARYDIGGIEEDNRALASVLVDVWAACTDFVGIRCPWDLTSSLF